MTLNRVLALSSVGLGALLVSQLGFGVRLMLPGSDWNKPPVTRLHASWVNNANTIEDGVDQSDHVAQVEVISLKKGPDIVLVTPNEPGGKDVIPTTLVTLKLLKTYKGAPGDGVTVELLQTGTGSDAGLLPAPPEVDEQGDTGDHAGKKGKAGKGRPPGTSPVSTAVTSVENRATILEDDKPYQIGEKYFLFMKTVDDGSGPAGALAGLPPGTVRAFAPEGRCQITKLDTVSPATTKKGFGPAWAGGRHKNEMEAEILAAVGQP